MYGEAMELQSYRTSQTVVGPLLGLPDLLYSFNYHSQKEVELYIHYFLGARNIMVFMIFFGKPDVEKLCLVPE